MDVELSGGIRDDESLAAALATGCRRVNLGTAALEDPEWTARVIGEHGDRIAVGLDVRGTTLAARGWTREGGDLWSTLERLDRDGCPRYVLTDVTKDGTLTGPNTDLLREFCGHTSAAVVASGGVSSLADVAALRALVDVGVEGAIVGKALYARAFTLEEALEVAGGIRGVSGLLTPTEFAGDDGRADPRLAAALTTVCAAADAVARMSALEEVVRAMAASPTSGAGRRGAGG